MASVSVLQLESNSKIKINFDGGDLSSDSGLILIKEFAHPQELKGVANLHTGSRMNADVIKITFDKDIELTVKWQGKSETIKLARQNKLIWNLLMLCRISN
ncbi:hypothetical protein [Alkaliphilus sp. B6464]|uniref:hypothetical protein n=1 Tax=Alkaliphilus sp. B6464 TaxID=2731219 RepID=UPI001BACF5E2|nr:hypothetical protein [Alkaliphilus sp. B6464]QUH18436.1 hypothetical protein HYG84_15950 [Alkaliphilus sp. B6464]